MIQLWIYAWYFFTIMVLPVDSLWGLLLAFIWADRFPSVLKTVSWLYAFHHTKWRYAILTLHPTFWIRNKCDYYFLLFYQDLDFLNHLVVWSWFLRVAELQPANSTESFLYFSSTFLYLPGSVRKALDSGCLARKFFKNKWTSTPG